MSGAKYVRPPPLYEGCLKEELEGELKGCLKEDERVLKKELKGGLEEYFGS